MDRTEAFDRAPAVAAHDDVVLLLWPEFDGRRRNLEVAARMRILLVHPDAPPPSGWTRLEDWIRRPADPDDVEARVATLRARAERRNGE